MVQQATETANEAATSPAELRRQRAAERRAQRAARREERRRAKEARSRKQGPAERHAGTTRVEGSPTVEGGDIIVTGLRQSVKESVDRKRKARQIVDVITAEDAGKLPDNNVVEAMARVTGIGVTRANGRADGFTIRGLAGVQTTINGNDVATAGGVDGGGRSMGLASIPADLVKSIEVYKTRTADQVEGGIAGSVNVELRRPLDLRKGWTTAGSFRETYSEQGSQWSPFASALIANRFDTGIGEMGFLINGSWNRQNYKEAFSTSESPQAVGWDPNSPIRLSLPADRRATAVAPFAAQFGESRGNRTQRSVLASFQWKPSNELSLVLEGNSFNENVNDTFANLYVNTIENFYTLRNIRYGANNALLGYDITIEPDAEGVIPNDGTVNVFAGGNNVRSITSDQNINFEMRWEVPGMWISSSMQYQWSNVNVRAVNAGVSYAGLNQLRVDFDSSNIPGGGPSFDFGSVSPTDPSRALLSSISDNVSDSDNKRFVSQIDLWKELSPGGLLRSMQIGYRFDRLANDFETSYRHAGWNPGQRPALSSLTGIGTIVTTPEIRGGKSLSWLQVDTTSLYDNWPTARQFIIANPPSFMDGPGRDRPPSEHFGTDRPNFGDPSFAGRVFERNFAAYATVNYAFKALFPIDGNVGVRYVNNIRSLSGFNSIQGAPIRDPNTGLPIPGEFQPSTSETFTVSSNDAFLMPSAFAMIHFTPQLQLRGSYSYNVQQPAIGDLRNWRSIDFANPTAWVNAGNPDLKATTTTDYNLALEWYFGRGGIVSFGSFWKSQDGFIYWTRAIEPIPELGGVDRLVNKPRNAGTGKTQGFEAQATSFFTFLPGFLRNLGATVNATFIPTATLTLPRDVEGQPGVTERIPTDSPFTSRWTYNLIGYYETPQFGARVAYNWRGEFKNGADAFGEFWIQSIRPTQRLDAAITYTPFRFLTLSLEGQNLTRAIDQSVYYRYPELPVGIRSMGRTFVLGARARF